MVIHEMTFLQFIAFFSCFSFLFNSYKKKGFVICSCFQVLYHSKDLKPVSLLSLPSFIFLFPKTPFPFYHFICNFKSRVFSFSFSLSQTPQHLSLLPSYTGSCVLITSLFLHSVNFSTLFFCFELIELESFVNPFTLWVKFDFSRNPCKTLEKFSFFVCGLLFKFVVFACFVLNFGF